MASTKGMSGEQQQRLSSLFHAYDVDNSGRIEKNEFLTICQELHVSSQEAEGIFKRLDVDNDGTVTLEEFISGFKEQQMEKDDDNRSEDSDTKSDGELPNNEDRVISGWDNNNNFCIWKCVQYTEFWEGFFHLFFAIYFLNINSKM